VTETVRESLPISQLVLGEPNFLEFERGSGNGRLYYNLHLNAYLPVETVTAVNRGVTVQRAYYDAPARQTASPSTASPPGSRCGWN
jgi:hypothetical protein